MVKDYLSKFLFSFLILFIASDIFCAVKMGVICDGSGSMVGFFNSGSIQEYLAVIEKRLSAVEDIQYEKLFFFEKQIISEKSFESFIKQGRWGQNTYLDIAFDNILNREYKIAILITDNLQDTPDESENTLLFYRRLSDERTKKIYFVPKFLHFEHRTYTGKKGVLIYLILFDEDYINTFEGISDLFNDQEKLLIKPVTKKEIEIRGTEDQINSPNAKIIKNGIIVPYSSQVYPRIKFNEKSSIRFNFLLNSRLNHINIGSNNKDDTGVKLEISVPQIIAQEGPLKRAMKQQHNFGTIVPPHLSGMLFSNQEQSMQVYSAELVMKPELSWGIRNFWGLTTWDWSRFWFKPVKILIFFNIRMTVPPDYFSLTEAYRERYFTSDIRELGRIYSPVDIICFINTADVIIDLNVTSY